MPCAVGSEIYLGSFRTGPITRWDYGGNLLGSFGSYRNCPGLKSLPNNQILIGHTPVDGQPQEWAHTRLAVWD